MKEAAGVAQNAPQEDRFGSDEEFEAFWDRLEAEAQAEREADAPGDPGASSRQTVADADQPGAYDRLLTAVRNRPLASELMRRTLELCEVRQPYGKAEQAIQQFPEYACAALTPWQVISTLVEAEGLRRIELDAAGEEILPEQKAGLSDDEVDDLVDSYALQTTDLGRLALEDLAPQRRLAQVFDVFRDRRDVFGEILSFCEQQPRTYQDIEALLSGHDFSNIASLNPQPGVSIQPSVFVDNLERAGGLVWDGGWRLTREGAMFLDRLATAG